MKITFGSLFAGIGGFDLGFERAEMECKWQVEIDEYATKILEKHWPNVHRERDIRECGKHNLEYVDVICGGFPCQDISYAGLGAGLDGERSGLFFEAVRLVRELQPRVVVLENVAALLTRGLDRVLGTLASIGFDAEWHCIPAAAVGAPHIRDRVFVLAYANQPCKGDGVLQRCGQQLRVGGNYGSNKKGDVSDATKHGRREGDTNDRWCYEGICERQKCRSGYVRATIPDANRGRLQECCECDGQSQGREQTQQRHDACRCGKDVADAGCQPAQIQTSGKFPTVQVPQWDSWWQTEPAVGRVANGVPNRIHRLRGLGNAVVPQVAEWIGRRVVETLSATGDG